MVLDTTGTLVNLVPGIGGAIASVLFGISGDRRLLGDLRLVEAGMLSGVVTGPSAVDLRPA
jgi:hypothetical protein